MRDALGVVRALDYLCREPVSVTHRSEDLLRLLGDEIVELDHASWVRRHLLGRTVKGRGGIGIGCLFRGRSGGRGIRAVGSTDDSDQGNSLGRSPPRRA